MTRRDHSTTSDVNSLKRAFTARQMSTQVRSRQTITVGLISAPEVAFRRLVEGNFDQAPVLSGKKLVGWVETSRLNGAKSVEEVFTPLSDCRFVSADSSLETVIATLPDQQFVFTVDENGIEGFVCVSDLDRHIVRAFFGMQLTQVEMILTYLARTHMPEEEVETYISRGSKYADGKSLHDDYKSAQEKGLSTHPAEYLYLGQLVQILKSLHADRKLKVSRSTFSALQVINESRNFLAHAARNLSAADGSKKMAKLQVAFNLAIAELAEL